MMSAWVNLVLTPPRYFLITGLTVLTLVFFVADNPAMKTHMDFELVLPYALGHFVPVGLLGLLIAGLLAAFMSNFAATVNAAPPYFVNDIYKRFINPNASAETYVRLSYLASFVVVVLGVASAGSSPRRRRSARGSSPGCGAATPRLTSSSGTGGASTATVISGGWPRASPRPHHSRDLGHIQPLQDFAAAHQLNLDVSLGLRSCLRLSLIGCIVGTLTTEARGGRDRDGLLPARAAVGFLGSHPRESAEDWIRPSSRTGTFCSTCSTLSWASPGR